MGRKVVPQPLVTIDCNGKDRVLVFPSDYVRQAKISERVELTLIPGFFGFYVIEKQTFLSRDSENNNLNH